MQTLPHGQLQWRSRRGAKELDLLLGGFLRAHYAGLTPREQHMFAQLLERPDAQLTDWLCNRRPPDPQLAAIVQRILSAAAR